MRRSLALALALVCGGWVYVEHLSLGHESYRRACEQLRTEMTPSTDAATQTRLAIACDNLDIQAQLYGQATALAGDRFGGPKDFLSTGAGWKAASRRNYYELALANTTHFHPYAAHEWRRYHKAAVLHAIEASKLEGLDAVEGLQLAIYSAAFGDHFLHDAFSAGHMGFNRSASSVAASLVYHDQWNERGRVVRDRAGRSWKTYGDGRLEAKTNADGRKHAADVAVLSIGGVLRAFVYGTRDPDHELAIWRALPYVIEAPETPSLTDRIIGNDDDEKSLLHPLEAINWPARKDRVVDISSVVTGSFTGDEPITALLLGYYVSLPLMSAPIHIGVGATVPHGPRAMHFVSTVGVTAPLGLTNEGLLEHQLCAGALWEARYSTVSGSLWAGYLLNIELGRNLIHLQVGPAFVAPEKELGFTAVVGFARVLSAAGGGAR